MGTKLTRRMVLLSVILMDLLAGMEFDLFVPSFPEIQTLFSLTPSWVAALLSVNFIGYCLGLFFVGSMADHYGRKPIITAGLIIFVLGSMLCLWSPTYHLMLVGRFLQGVGIAAPAILSFLIILYPLALQILPALKGRMSALLRALMLLVTALGLQVAAFYYLGTFQNIGFIVMLFMVGGILTLLQIIANKSLMRQTERPTEA